MGQTNSIEDETEFLEKNNYLNYDLTESKNKLYNYLYISSC